MYGGDNLGQSLLLFCPAVGTAGPLLKPRHDTPIMKDMLAVQQPDNLSLDEPLQADRTLLLRLPDLHLLNPLHPILPQTQQLLLQAVLLQSELYWVLEHQFMKLSSRHAIDGGFSGWIFFIIVGVDDGIVLILPIDEVEVVFAIGVHLDGSVRHSFQ